MQLRTKQTSNDSVCPVILSSEFKANLRPYTDEDSSDILETCLQYADTHTITNAKTALDFVESAISEDSGQDTDTNRFHIIEETYNTQQIIVWATNASPHSLAKAIRGICEFIFAVPRGQVELGVKKLVGIITKPDLEVQRGESFGELNTSSVIEAIQETSKVIMDRFISPSLEPHATLDELASLVEYINTIEDQAPRINYTFEYVVSDMTRSLLNALEFRLEKVFEKNINPQYFGFPIIKGPSGCGKTRLGFEIAWAMCKDARAKYHNNASYFCLRMSTVVKLRSALYLANMDNGGDNSENMTAYLIAVLLYAASNRKGLDGQVAQCLMQHAYNFRLADFLVMLKEKLELGILFLHIDEYREEMLGSRMLIEACTYTLLLKREDALRVYPIVTGMTSYIEASEADHGRAHTVSSLNSTAVITLGSLIGYKEALEDLELQFMKGVLFQAIRQSNHNNSSVGDPRLDHWHYLLDNEYFLGFLSELGGHPRFYTIAMRMIFPMSYSEKLLDYCCKAHDNDKRTKAALEALGDPPNLLLPTFDVREKLIDFLGSVFSLGPWESQVAQSVDFGGAQLSGRERRDIIRGYSVRTLKVLLILTITEMPFKANWNFNSALGSTNNQNCHFDLTIESAEHSGIFSVVNVPTETDDKWYHAQMAPILIATLNESCGLMSSTVLTCIPNFGTNHDLVDTLYIRLCAFVISKAADQNFVYSDFDKLRREFTPFNSNYSRLLTECNRLVIINDILAYGVLEIRRYRDLSKGDPSSYTIQVDRRNSKRLFNHNNTPMVCSISSDITVFEGISVFSVVRTDIRGQIDDDDLDFSKLSFLVCLSFHLPKNRSIQELIEDLNYSLDKNMFKKLIDLRTWFIFDVAYFHKCHKNELLAEFNEKLTENFASQPNFIGYYLTPIGQTMQFQSTYKHQPRSSH